MLSVDIKKRLPGFHLDVSFEVGDELVTLFGPSGAGKSLTLQCIAGLTHPDRGHILINGQPVFDASRRIDLPPQKRRTGYVFQNYALFPHLSVEENIAFGLHGLPDAEKQLRVSQAMASTRLQGLEKRHPNQLSAGQQQRVAFARALVTQPEVLLLDEPFSALDSIIRNRLQEELLQMVANLKKTVVLVTHNLAEAYMLSQKLVVYDAGRVLQVGQRDEVMYQPKTRAVARFTGTRNLFRGVVTRMGADGTEIQGTDFTVIAPSNPFVVGQEVDFCIRPEEIMLVRPDQEANRAVRENQLSGTIVREIVHGNSVTLFFKLDRSSPPDGRAYHFQIELPRHVYRRLSLDRQKSWTVSLKKHAIHLIPPQDEPDS